MGLHHKTLLAGDEPAIDQGNIYGWTISWNPDDRMFYVSNDFGETVRRFAEMRNVVQWARAYRRN